MQSPTRDREEAEAKERRNRKAASRAEGPNAGGYTSPPTDSKMRSLSPPVPKDRDGAFTVPEMEFTVQ